MHDELLMKLNNISYCSQLLNEKNTTEILKILNELNEEVGEIGFATFNMLINNDLIINLLSKDIDKFNYLLISYPSCFETLFTLDNFKKRLKINNTDVYELFNITNFKELKINSKNLIKKRKELEITKAGFIQKSLF